MVRGFKRFGAPGLLFGWGVLGCSSGEQSQQSQSPLDPSASVSSTPSTNPGASVTPQGAPSGTPTSQTPPPGATAMPGNPVTPIVPGVPSVTPGGATPPSNTSGPTPSNTVGQPPAPPPPATPVDCDAIVESGYQVCSETVNGCGVVFTDGSGCSEVCAAANLRCAAAYEDVEGQCAADAERPAVECDSGHQSDYCQCERDPSQSPPEPTSPDPTQPPVTSEPPETTEPATTSDETSTVPVMPGDAPCAVPEYIFTDTAPIGWAAEGGGTTGGGDGEAVLVTSLSELNAAVRDATPRVVYVQGELTPGAIDVGSNKTIIGCSSGAHVQGSISIGSGSSNVIMRNLAISGYGVGNCSKDPAFDAGEGCSSGSDAVGVNGDAHHVWVDHCSVKDGTDGNLDITNDANFVTVSWTKFSYTPRTDDVGSDSTGASGHRFSNLVGGTDSEPTGWPGTRPLNVTWHHNWWADNVVERQPRVRYGRNHLFNNYYNSSASNYCVRAGIEASILLQANAFDGVDSPHQFNNDSNEETAFIELGTGSMANVYTNVSGDRAEGGGGAGFDPPYAFEVDPVDGVPAAVKSGAGPH